MEGEKEMMQVVEEVYGHSDTDLPGERIFLCEGDLMEIRSDNQIDSDINMLELIAKTAAKEVGVLELAGWETMSSSVEDGSHLGQEEENELFINSFDREPSSQTGDGEEMKDEVDFTGLDVDNTVDVRSEVEVDAVTISMVHEVKTFNHKAGSMR
jgi:hypothetical protein